MITRQALLAVRGAVEQLPLRERELLMAAADDVPMKKLVPLFGPTEGAVRQEVFRLRKRLWERAGRAEGGEKRVNQAKKVT